MFKRFLVLAACLAPSLAIAQGLPWQQLELVGEARLNFLFWQIYEARLFSDDEPFSFPGSRPFALEIEYKREFSGEQLVDETRKQWQAIGVEVREDWLDRLDAILGNVSSGDVITLYVNEAGHSDFYFNGRLLGTIADPGFSNRFAAIWLSEKTTRPGFRAELMRNI